MLLTFAGFRYRRTADGPAGIHIGRVGWGIAGFSWAVVAGLFAGMVLRSYTEDPKQKEPSELAAKGAPVVILVGSDGKGTLPTAETKPAAPAEPVTQGHHIFLSLNSDVKAKCELAAANFRDGTIGREPQRAVPLLEDVCQLDANGSPRPPDAGVPGK